MAKGRFSNTDFGGFDDLDVESGAGTKKEQTVKASVRLPRGLNKKLKAAALARDTTVQDLLLQAVKDIVEG